MLIYLGIMRYGRLAKAAALSYKYGVRSIRGGEPHRGPDSLPQLVDDTRRQMCQSLGKEWLQ
jgi:hypothetical protein